MSDYVRIPVRGTISDQASIDLLAKWAAKNPTKITPLPLQRAPERPVHYDSLTWRPFGPAISLGEHGTIEGAIAAIDADRVDRSCGEWTDANWYRSDTLVALRTAGDGDGPVYFGIAEVQP